MTCESGEAVVYASDEASGVAGASLAACFAGNGDDGWWASV